MPLVRERSWLGTWVRQSDKVFASRGTKPSWCSLARECEVHASQCLCAGPIVRALITPEWWRAAGPRLSEPPSVRCGTTQG